MVTSTNIMKYLLLTIIATGLLIPQQYVYAQTSAMQAGNGFEDIQILVGDLYTVEVKNLKRISLTDPSVADISNAESNEILLSALQPGQTTLFIWDDSGKRTVIIRVISEDMSLLKKRLESLFDKAGVKGVNIDRNEYEGRIVLTGELLDEYKGKMDNIIEPFGDKIINMVKTHVIEDMIQIDMQITELNTTLAQTLGINWTNAGGDGLSLAFQEETPSSDGSFGDLFKIGDFRRTSTLLATIDALISEGKARILSKPRLVVTNGNQATFLVGGEIPIRSTVVNATGSNIVENITFKSYGVNMGITPTIKDGKIDISLNVEISDIDASNKVGADVAFITRSAQTQLMLDDGQTIVLAGMISKRQSETKNRIPILSKIPVVGALFRSSDIPQSDTEIVISLTPTILKSNPDSMKKVEEKKEVTAPAQRKDTPKAVENKIENTEEPKITKNPLSSSVRVPEEMSPYVQDVQKRISQAISYPFEAKEKGWTGTVKITMTVLNDGTLKAVDLKESSGYTVFDQDAVNTAQILAPYGPFPPEMGLEEIVVTVPIVYSQESFLQSATN